MSSVPGHFRERWMAFALIALLAAVLVLEVLGVRASLPGLLR